MGRTLMIIGIALILLGAMISFVGKLPGDIAYRRGNFTFYFPLMTSILLSIVISLLLWLFRR